MCVYVPTNSQTFNQEVAGSIPAALTKISRKINNLHDLPNGRETGWFSCQHHVSVRPAVVCPALKSSPVASFCVTIVRS
jgi:hypothetical protein